MNKDNIILKVENISKQYRLGLVGTSTIVDDLKRWWYRIRGKEDPFLKVGDVNDRTVKGDSNYVWAIKDINFNVKQGEVLGIIGKNGAGKSTLLKILSRVTAPTTGEIKTKGRIASLLEVGTGFHSELTGRENIFLNGAILGMTKVEITEKIDDIISFSGCERYIDTPVKRYSSGMTVRLAFAVAAFLEPDILVIDEVLAVGDAEFQKKAIGKMQDISKGEGRTVLFVSHNMAAVKSLCTRAIVLEYGKITFLGNTDEAVSFYLKSGTDSLGDNLKYFNKSLFENNSFILKELRIRSDKKKYKEPITREDGILIEILLEKHETNILNVVYLFKDEQGNYIFATNSNLGNIDLTSKGFYKLSMYIPKMFFNEGVFNIDLMITDGKNQLFFERDSLMFTVVQEQMALGAWMGKSPGALKPKFEWKIT